MPIKCLLSQETPFILHYIGSVHTEHVQKESKKMAEKHMKRKKVIKRRYPGGAEKRGKKERESRKLL